MSKLQALRETAHAALADYHDAACGRDTVDHVGPLCRMCGRETMHLGDVCFACCQKLSAPNGCLTDIDTGATHCCESHCAVSTDYVLDRATLERLLVGPVDVGSDHAGGVTITLHPEARMIVDLIVHADLTDPRGVTDARLSRLRVAIKDLIESERPYGMIASLQRESLVSLTTAYHSVFIGS